MTKTELERKILGLVEAYGTDYKGLLRDNPNLDYLYAFSPQRENLMEWYPMRRDAKLLQIGSDFGALTGVYSRKVAQVDVLDTSWPSLEINRERHVEHGACKNIQYVQGTIEEYLAQTKERYDYIVIAGSLDEDYQEQFRLVRRLLKPAGELIMAVCNPLGVKYWAGAKKDDVSLSLKKVIALLSEDGTGEDLEFYYPMPDYKLPVTIYSDAYLPGVEDLADAIGAYDYPKYSFFDVGAAYAEVCGDGRFTEFANSYLVIWRRSGRKYQTAGPVYMKYNRTRADRFQIKTVILGGQEHRKVEKSALTEEAAGHILEFGDNYKRLSAQHKFLRFAEPEIDETRAAAVFPYLTGRSLAEQVYQELVNGSDPVELIRQTIDVLLAVEEDALVPFEGTPEFAEVFGEEAMEALTALSGTREETAEGEEAAEAESAAPMLCFRISNIDLLFENILLLESQEGESEMCCLDYEWVFTFPIPVDFVRYRMLAYAYRQYRSLLAERGYETDAAWMEAFGLTPETEEIYRKMEAAFQNYVHGENQQIYLGNYLVELRTVADYGVLDEELIRKRREVKRAEYAADMIRYQMKDQEVQMKNYALAKDQLMRQEVDRQIQLREWAVKEKEEIIAGKDSVIEQKDSVIREKDALIQKMTEVKRLTDNHVTNLEAMIGDMKHEIGELNAAVSYYVRHQTLYSRIRRKLGDQFNKMYPKGSAKREKLRRIKTWFRHPVSTYKFCRSEEGQNKIEGAQEIGEAYWEYGRLVFPAAENPIVSIIIPVYNQLEYTYKCLVSILEHTKDVSCEIIIADDVSTDGTERLGRYSEGLVICRNETNQGFLKNCNHAAKQARGRYLMFLNNDTQVTEGWLSSLVELIESDPSIGMVGSKLVFPDGRLQEAGGIIWSDGSGWNYGRLDDPDKPEYNYVKDVDYISGAAILISHDLWNQIGGFDERFAPAYCEDSDLAFEVRKAGYRVVYQPKSKVIHFEGVSNGTDVQGTGLKRYQVENSEKLREKWADEFAKQCENNGNPDPFRARERSMGKTIVLVVDHYVPTYDRDAGSKTTFQYLKMFLKKGLVVKFIGDNYAHEEPYATTLEQMGIEVLSGPGYAVGVWDWIKKHGHDISVAYLNRPHIASRYINFIRENTNMKVIYYGHDLHFLREGREYELTQDPERKESAKYWKAIEMSLMYNSDVVYYPSYVERDAILGEDDTIPVKDIVAYVYEQFRQDIPENYEEREGLLFVGGFGHPPNADAVLWFAREVYPLIRQNMEAAGQTPPVFYVVGSKATDEILALEEPDNGIVIKGFVTEEELTRLYDTTRLVVAPLRYGAGVKGKIVEALYNGAAVVTTSIGAEGIPDAETVMAVADEEQAFADVVTELYLNPEECRDLSLRTQDYVRRNYSMDAAWSVIEEDFLPQDARDEEAPESF